MSVCLCACMCMRVCMHSCSTDNGLFCVAAVCVRLQVRVCFLNMLTCVCVRSKAWLAARVSLRLARVPRLRLRHFGARFWSMSYKENVPYWLYLRVCVRSKSWLAARASLRPARVPRRARARRSRRLRAALLLDAVRRTLNNFAMLVLQTAARCAPRRVTCCTFWTLRVCPSAQLRCTSLQRLTSACTANHTCVASSDS